MTHSEMIKEKVKPCPFCGATPNLFIGFERKAVIRCSDGCNAAAICEIRTDINYNVTVDCLFDAFNEAIRMWNKRNGV